MPDFQSTTRFSDRVENYIRYRPGYPPEMVRVIAEAASLHSDSVIADIGSGTGISTEIFLKRGNTVFAVEPNGPMRVAAELRFSNHPRFRSVNGTAEATGLANHSVDLVIAGQAFHWFDQQRARVEFTRILRPGSMVALFWNNRQIDASPFLKAYEELLNRFCSEYSAVNHTNVGEGELSRFFGDHGWELSSFPNSQQFKLEGLRGRLLSCSYAPPAGHPQHEPMLGELKRIFDQHAIGGVVEFQYATELHIGRIA